MSSSEEDRRDKNCKKNAPLRGLFLAIIRGFIIAFLDW